MPPGPLRAGSRLARSACLTRAIHSPGEISPGDQAREAIERRAARCPPCARPRRSAGTESSASEAWPMIPGICSAGVPCPSSSPARRLRLPSARIVAVRSPTPAMPANVSCSAPRAAGVGDALPPHLGGGDPGRVHPLGLGRGAGEGGRVLGGARDLDADHVLGALADQARLVEDAAELVAQVGVAAAEHQRGGPRHRLLGVRRAAERGDRAGADALGDVLGGQGAPSGRPCPC